MASDNIRLVRRFFDEVCSARRLDVADQLSRAITITAIRAAREPARDPRACGT